ncbi:MAG TPA: LPS assembly protein LptD [Hyphomonadaceae bacterium]|nr:LPS assembly protein LptD [Hyphomonadaceae bacterium]
MVLRLACLASVAAVAITAGSAAYAQQAPVAPVAPTPATSTTGEEGDDVVLQADTIEEDQETLVITASGNVEIRVGQRTMLADRVIYDRRTETMRAQGNVQLSDGSGQVQFADEIEADENIRNGFATKFSARLLNNGLITSSSAVRTDGTKNALDQVVYTNCPICEEKGQKPTWVLRSRRAMLDQEDQMITYNDAVLEVAGVPVIYVPWFGHPDPNSERRSGLMTPDLGISSKIGAFYEQPYYLVIDPSQDVTISPMVSTEVNPLVKVDYRKRFFSGYVQAESSFTYEQEFNSDGEKFGDKTWRSHLYGSGLFDINQDWRWGFGIERQTDDLYDKRYNIDGEDDVRGLIGSQPRQLLTQLYTTGQQPDFYFEAATYLFQGLRASDNDASIPKIAPSVFAEKVFDFGPSGGQLAADFSAVALFRDLAATLPGTQPAGSPSISLDSARMTASADWRAQYIVGPGFVVEPFGLGRGDVYRIDDGTAGGKKDISRILGVAGAQVSYPLINRGKDMDIIVEPIAMVAYGSPNANTDGIPNEDSLVFEADETNLFRPNAVSNYDLWEGGARMSIGVNATAKIGKDIELSTLVGKRWREDADPAFNDLSNLAGEESDYVASVRADLGAIFNVGARFRMDEDYTVKRMDVDAGANFWRVSGSARYFQIAQTSAGVKDEGIAWGGKFKLTDRWSAIFNQTRNITQKEDIRLALGIAYQDECSWFQIAYEREGGRDRTLGPSESIRFLFVLTGLGGVSDADTD